MAKFLKRASLFAVLLLVYFGMNWLLNTLIFSFSEVPLKDKRVLILGDSHTRRAIDPSLFESAENISQQSEMYVLSYWKLKYLLKEIKTDTVLIGFSPHNISAFNDNKLSDEKWSTEMFKRSYLINDFKNLKDMEVDKDEYYKIYFQKMLLYPNFNHYEFIGNFKNSNRSRVDDAEKVAGRHYYYDAKELPASETSISYLDSIITLCREKKVVPILIASPVYKEYNTRIPTEIKSRYNALKDKYKAENIRIIDMSTANYADSLFYNSDHLNKPGAIQFTNAIIDSLKSK